MALVNFTTKSVEMAEFLLVDVQAPQEDVERIMEHVCKIDPLAQGAKYDCNAHQSARGIERYRPLEGAIAGVEEEVRLRPGIVRINFEITNDQKLLEKIVETIFQVHSYQEPVIRIHKILSCRSRGLDDSANPHRWWNTTGDWKKSDNSENQDRVLSETTS
ncbi:MAG: hypothetical protein L3J32_12860 [Rhizobiaceae bacterium]|nr:hypothetical protein [Rhizobiaceae bacterium]